MIKAKGKLNGKEAIFIGLSYGNLNKFRDGPLDSFITIHGSEIGIDHDILIFSGRNEEDMAEFLSAGFVPNTIVTISSRSKN